MSHKADKTLLADLLKVTEPPQIVKVESPPMDMATTYWHVGRRDLLAELCVIIRMRGAQAVLNEIPQMLQKYEPDHCHAKAVLKEYHPKHRKAA